MYRPAELAEPSSAGAGKDGRQIPRSRWSRVRRVFLAALDQPTEARGAFVANACGSDAEARREVDTLLASDAAAGSFCEAPAALLLRGLDAGAAPAVRRLPIGSRLQDFEIAGFLGSGGMGEVYLARDIALGRQVAIKTVSAALSDASARTGLLSEAQHASILRHPHICAIHHIGHHGAVPFIVMEYVDGDPLHERLNSAPLPVAEVLTYGSQVAEAIEHAHTRGIVHRDLKSSNVLISRERGAVVLDFGLAKRLPQEDGQQTATSARLAELAGTLSHMAPELLLGSRADVRSDVWALGVLLYEMVSGSLPFSGRTSFETTSAILGLAPAPLPRSVPLALRVVIARCLEKNPARRYRRAGDVAAALARARSRYVWPLAGALWLGRRTLLRGAAAVMLAGIAAGLIGMTGDDSEPFLRSSVSTPRTVAVLTLDSAEEDAHYAAGITEAIIGELGELRELRVIARGSIDRLRGEGRPPQQIAQATGAAAVVHGAVQRAGVRIGVEVQLIDAATGRLLWSDRFERGIKEVLALQADVIAGLARAIPVAAQLDARAGLRSVRAVNPDVYEAYLHGRYHWGQRTRGSLHEAIDAFTRAITLDPTFAPAYAALADCYNQLGTVLVGTGSPASYRPQAAAAAIKALQLDPSLAEAHATLGYIKHYDLEWEEAERHLRRAIELNPSYPLARIWYANLLMSLGRLDEALRQVYIARDLDPFSLVVNTNIGWVLAFAWRHEEAVAQFERTLAMDGSYVQAHQRMAASLLALDRAGEALAHAERAVALTDRSPAVLGALVPIYVRLGRRADAEQVQQEVLEASKRQYIPAWSLAQIYFALGDRETAVQWIVQAADERSNAVAYFGIDEKIGELRGDPRVDALLARAGLDTIDPVGRRR